MAPLEASSTGIASVSCTLPYPVLGKDLFFLLRTKLEDIGIVTVKGKTGPGNSFSVPGPVVFNNSLSRLGSMLP